MARASTRLEGHRIQVEKRFMRLGPVLERELVVTARRARFFALRSLYGLVLLALVVSVYRNGGGLDGAGSTITFARGSELARGLFASLILIQWVAVIFLTPALVSGAIAGEYQRKTLHDLLSSDLTDAEIVLGKLTARLVHIVTLLATGLPILVLAGLLGGLDLGLTVLAELAILSTTFFLGALSILGSTQTRSARGALNFTMTLTLTWLILPGATVVLLPDAGHLGFVLYDWFGPLNAWISASSPFSLWIASVGRTIRGADDFREQLLWMIGLQVVYGGLLALLATCCLRRSYRNRQGASRRRTWAFAARVPRRRRVVERPGCGRDPMLWKELVASRTPAFYGSLGLLTTLMLGCLLVWTTFDYAAPAFRELLQFGYGVAPSGSARALFHFYLRIAGTAITLITVLGIASDAAASIAGEREKDTWVSLTATPLTGTEIVRAKIIGAMWGIRHIAVVLALLWGVGMLAGSVHPLGFVACLIELAAIAWFAAALGIWISLRSEQTLRAVAKVTGVLVLLNAGVMLAALTLWPGQPFAFFGCIPVLLCASLVSFGEVSGTVTRSVMGPFSDLSLSTMWGKHGAELAFTCVLGTASYAVAAFFFTRSACRQFDTLLDRPKLAGPERESKPVGPTMGHHGGLGRWVSTRLPAWTPFPPQAGK
ncbi:ABC transporter permease subunit [Singulisphaera sp. Ch08]|uniref:ABC transporter permease subunit n=1 Tax=Singulisphaera sp. Ch08 TaxID=3120278 RepID=A0AAU7CCI2_9BACT